MTDTTPKPYLEIIKGLMPSLNSSIVAIVSSALAIAGTLATQKVTASPTSPPAPRIEYVNAIPAWLGPKMDACVSGVAELQARLPKGKKK